MATNTLEALPPRAAPLAAAGQVIDRWIYVFMAGFFLVITLVGFIPDSIEKLAAIRADRRPPFPLVLHVHAILMGAWLLLLLAQTSLVATNRRAFHRRLGVVSLVLVPAMVTAGVILVPLVFRTFWSFGVSPPAGAEVAALPELAKRLSNLFLLQIRIGILFPLFVAWALLVRRKDPETHKRLMILATILLLPAAIDRIDWLPHTLPASATSVDLYMLLCATPMFIRDVVRCGRVPRAYVIWIAVGLPFTIAAHSLWSSSWWLATAPKIIGFGP
jgi:hypothetical protein